MNSRYYSVNVFITEICVLGESCVSMLNLLTSLDSESKNFVFGKKVVDRFLMAAAGVVIMLYALYEM